MSKIITVRSCAECPFFQQTAIGVIAGLMLSKKVEKPPLVGSCGCPEESGLMHFPAGSRDEGEVAVARERQFRRMKILDGNALPTACPLYRENVTVTIKVPS